MKNLDKIKNIKNWFKKEYKKKKRLFMVKHKRKKSIEQKCQKKELRT